MFRYRAKFWGRQELISSQKAVSVTANEFACRGAKNFVRAIAL